MNDLATSTATAAAQQTERVRNTLAIILVIAFIGIIPGLMYFVVPEKNKDLITYMLGQLSGMALTALGFYFVKQAGQDAVDAKRAENTGKLADAVVAAANATPPNGNGGAGQAADDVVDAADAKRNEIKGEN